MTPLPDSSSLAATTIGEIVAADYIMVSPYSARGYGVFNEVKSKFKNPEDPFEYVPVKLKALVKPVMPESGEGIRVKLALSRERLKEGEEVRILYQTNADCYVYIFSVAADNLVTLLFPNSVYQDNFVKADTGRTFPPDDSSMKLRAAPLPEMKGRVSQERVKIIASRKREIILERGFQEGMFQVYDARTTGLVGDLARKLNQLDPADWGEMMTIYTIEPAGAPR